MAGGITQNVFDLGAFATKTSLSTPVSWDTSNPTGMEGIPSPAFPIRPSQQTVASPSGGSPKLADPSSILNAAAENLSGHLGLQMGGFGSSLATGNAVEKYVVIIIGLVVLAAGVFSFERAQQVGVQFAKGIAEGAATA